MKTIYKQLVALFVLFSGILASTMPVYAETSEVAHQSGGGHDQLAIFFLFFAVLMIAAKMGSVVERWGLPGVIGELLMGVVLSFFVFMGIPLFAQMQHNQILAFIAEFGAIILLFQIGLESNIKQITKTGITSMMVAIIGAVIPFVLGAFVLGPLLFPHVETASHLFLGAALVATSVGITATVMKQMGFIKTRLGQTFLGASVLDDIFGLIVLAVVSAFVMQGSFSISTVGVLLTKAVGFLAIAVVIGHFGAGYMSAFFSKIHTGHGMKLAVALGFALIYAYLATLVGLAPIVGAFAAGLVLDAVHFKMYEKPTFIHLLDEFAHLKGNSGKDMKEIMHKMEHTHIEDMINGLSIVFVPMFFTYTGMQIDFASLLQPKLYILAAIITIFAILGKLLAGTVVKGSFLDKLIVGTAMVPRGEVGLIFATVGIGMGVLSSDLFSVIVIVILATTFIAPPVLKKLVEIRRNELKNPSIAKSGKKTKGFGASLGLHSFLQK